MMCNQEELPVLGTFARVASVAEATNLKFIPTTHQEKNSALELADYLDKPQYPGGVHDRLMEIYDHQVKTFEDKGKNVAQAKILAGASVKSVLHTYGDYLANARYSYRLLSGICRLLDVTPNQRLSLAQAFKDGGMDPTDAAPLVRYIDQHGLMKAPKNWQQPFDPFLTVENRDNPLKGANKRIEDVYTGENDRVVAERIEEFLGATIVKGIYRSKTVGLAKDDQERRGRFWVRVLEGTRGAYRSMGKAIIDSANIGQKVG